MKPLPKYGWIAPAVGLEIDLDALPGRTGCGSVTHWNAFVANLEMHGKGTFFDPRLNDPDQFPIADRSGLGMFATRPT